MGATNKYLERYRITKYSLRVLRTDELSSVSPSDVVGAKREEEDNHDHDSDIAVADTATISPEK